MKAKYILSAIALLFLGTFVSAENTETRLGDLTASGSAKTSALTAASSVSAESVRNGGWDDWDDEDEFQYSRRLRRFQRNGNSARGNHSWGYYDPYFTSNVYYTIGTPMWSNYFYYQPVVPVVQVNTSWWWAFTVSMFYTPTYFNYGYYNPYGGGWGNGWYGGAGYYGYNHCGGWHPHGYWNGYNQGFNNGYWNGYNQGYWAGYNQGMYNSGYGNGYNDDWWYWRKQDQTNPRQDIGVHTVNNSGNSIPRQNQNSNNNIGVNPKPSATQIGDNPRNNPTSVITTPRPKWDSQAEYQGGAVKGNPSEPRHIETEPRPRTSWSTEPRTSEINPTISNPKGNMNGSGNLDNVPRNNNQGNFNTEPVRPRQENFDTPRNNQYQSEPRPRQNESWNAPTPRSNSYQTEPVKPRQIESQPRSNYENSGGFNSNGNQGYGRPSNQSGFEQSRPRNNQPGTGAAQNGQLYPSHSGQQPVVKPRTEPNASGYSPRPQSQSRPEPRASQPAPRSSSPAPSGGRPSSGNTPGKRGGLSYDEATHSVWMVVP